MILDDIGMIYLAINHGDFPSLCKRPEAIEENHAELQWIWRNQAETGIPSQGSSGFGDDKDVLVTALTREITEFFLMLG